MEMIGHHTIADQPHRQTGASLTKKGDEGVVILVIVEHLRPTVAAVEGMVAIAADRASRSSWHEVILAAVGLSGKRILLAQAATGIVTPTQKGILNVP
jgi:hypothetical protein